LAKVEVPNPLLLRHWIPSSFFTLLSELHKINNPPFDSNKLLLTLLGYIAIAPSNNVTGLRKCNLFDGDLSLATIRPDKDISTVPAHPLLLRPFL
jgi:hypothetical protein